MCVNMCVYTVNVWVPNSGVNGNPWSWLKLISLKKWMAGGGNNNFSPIAQAKK